MSTLYVISGVAGMTGSELAKQIVARNDSAIGFDNFFCSSKKNLSDVAEHAHFTFFEYDLRNAEQMAHIKTIVQKKKVDYKKIVYINCAAVVHTEYFYQVNQTFETNVVGMKNFLEQAITVGAETYINCSTSEVYSMRSFADEGVKESDYVLFATAEHSQRTSYAAGKLLTEFFLKDAVDAGKIKGCSIRFANVYSKDELYAKHILPFIIQSLLDNGKVTLLENSRKNKRTFLHNIDSCASVLCLADKQDALDGTVYNVATDEEISILDLVHLCAKKLGIENPEIHFSGYRASDPERRLLNTEKIRTRTAWKPKISLSEGIDMIIAERKSRK